MGGANLQIIKAQETFRKNEILLGCIFFLAGAYTLNFGIVGWIIMCLSLVILVI